MAVKRAFGSRRAERGAAVFIVVMVITLLTAVGIFAARSTSLTDVAAGFEREASQTAYLAQLAGNAAATDIGINGQMWAGAVDPPQDTCAANRGATTKVQCARMKRQYLDDQTVKRGGESLLDATSLNASGALNAEIMVELTELGPAEPVAGGALNGPSVHSFSIVVTTTARIKDSATLCGPGDVSVPQQQTRSVVIAQSSALGQ